MSGTSTSVLPPAATIHGFLIAGSTVGNLEASLWTITIKLRCPQLDYLRFLEVQVYKKHGTTFTKVATISPVPTISRTTGVVVSETTWTTVTCVATVPAITFAATTDLYIGIQSFICGGGTIVYIDLGATNFAVTINTTPRDAAHTVDSVRRVGTHSRSDAEAAHTADVATSSYDVEGADASHTTDAPTHTTAAGPSVSDVAILHDTVVPVDQPASSVDFGYTNDHLSRVLTSSSSDTSKTVDAASPGTIGRATADANNSTDAVTIRALGLHPQDVSLFGDRAIRQVSAECIASDGAVTHDSVKSTITTLAQDAATTIDYQRGVFLSHALLGIGLMGSALMGGGPFFGNSGYPLALAGHARAGADNARTADAAIQHLTPFRVSADAARFTDAATRRVTDFAATTDVTRTVDSLTGLSAYPRTIHDVALTADRLLFHQGFVESVQDVSLEHDVAAGVAINSRFMYDADHTLDRVARVVRLVGVAVDRSVQLDTARRHVVTSRTADDVAHLVDANRRVDTYLRAVSDHDFNYDRVARLVQHVLSATDKARTIDQIARFVTASFDIARTVDVVKTDLMIRVFDQARVIDHTKINIGIPSIQPCRTADIVLRRLLEHRRATDRIDTADGPTRRLIYSRSVIDGALSADLVTHIHGARRRTTVDDVRFADAATQRAGLRASASDRTRLLDSVRAILLLSRSIADHSLTPDSATSRTPRHRLVFDQAATRDALERGLVLARALQDASGARDAAHRFARLLGAATDSSLTATTVAHTSRQRTAVTDLVLTPDSAQAVLALVRKLSDYVATRDQAVPFVNLRLAYDYALTVDSVRYGWQKTWVFGKSKTLWRFGTAQPRWVFRFAAL